MNETQSPTKKISFFFIVVISVMLVLSIMALYQAFETYRRNGNADLGSILLGVSAIALSSYMLVNMRRKPLKLGFEMPKVLTNIQCTKCDFKNAREFQGGDYVLKEVGSCPKCNNSMIISSIYKEVKEKEK